MKKDFDCIADKRRIQAEIYEETKHMSDAERQAWTEQQIENGSLRDWWAKVKTATEARAEEARRRRQG